MVVQFESPDGSVLARLDKTLNPSALPIIIVSEGNGFWFRAVTADDDHPFLPAYRLAREVSQAKH